MNRTDCPDQHQLLCACTTRLGADEQTALRQHLAGCPHCRQELATLRCIAAALPAQDWSCPPQEASRFAAQVHKRLYAPAPRRRSWPLSLAATTLACAALLLVARPAPHNVDTKLSAARQQETLLYSSPELLENLDLLQQLDLLEGLEESG